MKNEDKQQTGLRLPERLVTAVELARTIRELKRLDDWLNQAALRSGGAPVSPPKTSVTLEETANINNVSLLDAHQRQQLIDVLVAFGDHAPRIKMSFSVEPSANFLSQMIVWLRANLSPLMLLDVGLQPTLAAGCVVKTNNKVMDLSLRNRFRDSRSLLVQSIAEIEKEFLQANPSPAPVPQEAVPNVASSTEQPAQPAASSTAVPVTTTEPSPTGATQ